MYPLHRLMPVRTVPALVTAAVAPTQQVLLGEDHIPFRREIEVAVDVALFLQAATARVVRVG